MLEKTNAEVVLTEIGQKKKIQQFIADINQAVWAENVEIS